MEGRLHPQRLDVLTSFRECSLSLTVLFSLLSLATPSLADATTAADGFFEARESAARESVEPSLSLFDQLFGQLRAGSIRYEIPYPFERFTDSLTEKLSGCTGRRSPPYANVLIPIGRSSQRDIEGLEFFKYPRVILGVDTEGCRRLLSKDRLFFAYQEKAQTIEIISYNETRGQFDFQLIENYRNNQQPVVRNARRDRCLQCHQNGSAIFPQFNWSETNFDQRIAQNLARYQQFFHGIGTDQLSAKAGRVDGATDRANLLSVYQTIWRSGCDTLDYSQGLQCRAGIFERMLQHRLGIVAPANNPDSLSGSKFARLIQDQWNTLWPEGLPVPDPDLPNQLPGGDANVVAASNRLDPTAARPPRAHWQADDDLDRALRGMANAFILQADINRLDKLLHRLSAQTREYNDSYQGACIFDHVSQREDTWVDADCSVSTGGLERSLIAAQLYMQDQRTIHPALSWIYLTHHNPRFISHATLSGHIEQQPNSITSATLSLRKRHKQIRARVHDGQAMAGIELFWDQNAGEPIEGGMRYPGRIRLTLANDQGYLNDAVQRMLEDSRTGLFDGFANKPIRGIHLMDALFEKLSPVTLSLSDVAKDQLPQ